MFRKIASGLALASFALSSMAAAAPQVATAPTVSVAKATKVKRVATHVSARSKSNLEGSESIVIAVLAAAAIAAGIYIAVDSDDKAASPS